MSDEQNELELKRVVERMVAENPDIPPHQLIALGQNAGEFMVNFGMTAQQAVDHVVSLARTADPKLHVRKSGQQAELERHVAQLHKDRDEMKRRGGGQ